MITRSRIDSLLLLLAIGKPTSSMSVRSLSTSPDNRPKPRGRADRVLEGLVDPDNGEALAFVMPSVTFPKASSRLGRPQSKMSSG